jgi:hypothetical protein
MFGTSQAFPPCSRPRREMVNGQDAGGQSSSMTHAVRRSNGLLASMLRARNASCLTADKAFSGAVAGRGQKSRTIKERGVVQKAIKTLPRQQLEASHTPFDFRIVQWMSVTLLHSSYFVDSVVGFVHVHDKPIVHPVIGFVSGQPVPW